MGFPPFLRQAKRHVEKCSTKQKTKHNGWKYKHSKNSSSSAKSQLNHDDSYDESKSKSFVRKWITRQICFKWTMRACLSPQAHPSNKAPEIIEFLNKKKHPGFWRVWFFFRTLFAGFYHFTSFPKHFASLRTPNPPHFSAPKKWQWLSKTQGGHQTVGGSHGGSDGLWICGVATGHAPQVDGSKAWSIFLWGKWMANARVVSVTRVETKSTKKKTHTLDKHTGVFFKVKEKISLHLLGVKKKQWPIVKAIDKVYNFIYN